MRTEADWELCDDPQRLLRFVGDRADARKLRLFACACVRELGGRVGDPRAAAALEVAERFDDGFATEWERHLAERSVQGVARHLGRHHRPGVAWAVAAAARHAVQRRNGAVEAARCAAQAMWLEASERCPPGGRPVGLLTRNQYAAGLLAHEAMCRTQCDLLRDVCGGVVHPTVLAADWLCWNDGVVVRIARSVYDERAFERLPILADALEDAGCNDARLLAHCRGPARHVRGCWVVDRLLGNE
jgi:hypothetical protein